MRRKQARMPLKIPTKTYSTMRLVTRTFMLLPYGMYAADTGKGKMREQIRTAPTQRTIPRKTATRQLAIADRYSHDVSAFTPEEAICFMKNTRRSIHMR
ncbi:hypothetical protein G7K_3141-t1 [Saitoella complicata NRRL Y-17804]|uniref:Uncharacterized protein n=1 Tax=Saitoella complicata (strain BCRC 22490 / CBS 7301 / JCM 7358 / NBRC 10748 / NRRL Y-17804) TaxID=698492 RepID=A0A0E9NHU7_SAICN|nr:hypothetical protein G7K_3141-t1 [Saitoella complicata NRRL Y-17804]